MIDAKNILVLYITERSGHHSAALAIKKGFEVKDPQSKVICVNAFKYAFPFAERLIHRIYLAVIQKFPIIWESMYDNPMLVGGSRGIKKWIHHLAIKRLISLIKRFEPGAILCTQAFPCGIVAEYKKACRSNIPLIGVLTDFAPHSFWVYDEVDAYVVPCNETKDMLTGKGVAEEKIKVLGIPIDPKFAMPLDRKELFANFGLNPEIPVVMVMGGSHGLGPIKEVLHTLDNGPRPLQIIVVCGINVRLYNWVIATAFKNRVLTFKFSDAIDRLMTLSSLIITKPGGITTAEALAKQLPMIILNPIPGQEARNTQVLLKNGAALKVDRSNELLPAIEKVLEKPREGGGILSIFNQRHDLSRPDSSVEIAEFVLSLFK